MDWQFAPSSLYVDEESYALFWNDDKIVSTSLCDNQLHVQFGATWQEFLSQGDLQAFYSKANSSLQKSLLRK